MNSFVPVGRILSAHGIRGEVNFLYYNEVYQDFLRYTSVFYEKEGEMVELRVRRVRLKDKRFILQFEDVKDRTSAENLAGKTIYVKEEDLPKLEDGEYYVFQLLEAQVLDENGKTLGKVKNVLKIGPNSILEVKGDEEILIPMVEDFILKVDVKERVIRVRRPEYI